MEALKEWNESKRTGGAKFCIPKKGSKQYMEIIKLMNKKRKGN